MFIYAFTTATPLSEVLQVLWSSLSYLPLQNKTSLWFKASLWIRRKRWCSAAAADVMDQEESCQVWFQTALMVYVGPWSGSRVLLLNFFTVHYFDCSFTQHGWIFIKKRDKVLQPRKHCFSKYFMGLQLLFFSVVYMWGLHFSQAL